MKKLVISFSLLVGMLSGGFSQIKVADDNNVGIGVTSPVSKFAVGAAGNTSSTLYVENTSTSSSARAGQFYKSTCGGDYSFALISRTILGGGKKLIGGNFTCYNSSANGTQRTTGVRAIAGNGLNGYNYGVHGWLYGTRNGAAIYGDCGSLSELCISGQWAGYFNGDVRVTDTLKYHVLVDDSDINLKKDIRSITEEGVSHMDKLNNLTVIKYKLKNPIELNLWDQEDLDTMKVDPRTLSYDSPKYTEDKIGLSAQEVQVVYPELVKEGSNGYLTMNYVGLIPILIEALKEQDAAIIELDEAGNAQNESIIALTSEIDYLKEEIDKLKNPEKTK